MDITKEFNKITENENMLGGEGITPKAPPANSAVTMVSLSNSQIDINVGETESLRGTVFPSTAISKTLTWTSSNTNVARVTTGTDTSIATVTAVGRGTAVITAKSSNGKYDTCTVNVVNEREFHLIAQSGNGNALYLGDKTKNILDYDDEVNDKRVYTAAFTYSNREKWVFRWDSDGVKIHTAANKNFALCKNTNKYADLAACVSETATDGDSKLTISYYNGNSDLLIIKLKNAELYLTSSGDSVYWQSYNSSNPTNQIWKIKDKPANIHYGLDTCDQLTDNDISFLVQAGEEFVCRYYKPTPTHGYLLKSAEVQRLHNAGIHIVSVYQDRGKNGDFNRENGITDAEKALMRASEVNQPNGSAIYFAVDDDVGNDATAIANIVAYFDAIKTTLGNQYKVGVYGSGDICGRIKQDLTHADYSWLAQGTRMTGFLGYDDISKYNIKQAEYVYYNGKTYDEDIAVGSDYGQW